MTSEERIEKMLEEPQEDFRNSKEEETLSSEDLDEIARSLEEGVESGRYDGKIFATGGTTGQPTRAYFTERAAESIVERASIAQVDTEEGDKSLNLFAPKPHISGWLHRRASEGLGAEALNDSYEDWESIIEEDMQDQVTEMAAVPTLAYKMANVMEEKFDEKPTNLFPNLENAYLSGMPLTDDMRDALQVYGLNLQRDSYASSEAGVMGMSINPDSSQQVPVPGYVFEVIPETGEEPVDIRDVENETEGVLLVSDPSRRLFPENIREEDIPQGYSGEEKFIRWYTGDKIKVKPRQEIAGTGNYINTFEVLGKEKFDLNIGGAILEENQLHTSIVENYEDDGKIDWKAVKTREESENELGDLFLHVYVTDTSNLDYEGFFESLYSNKSIEEADRKGVVKGIDFHPMSNYNLEEESMKGRHVVDET